MNTKLTVPFMHATDVEPHNDYAYEMVGVDRERGLYVLDEAGEEIRFSVEVQDAIHEALGSFLATV